MKNFLFEKGNNEYEYVIFTTLKYADKLAYHAYHYFYDKNLNNAPETTEVQILFREGEKGFMIDVEHLWETPNYPTQIETPFTDTSTPTVGEFHQISYEHIHNILQILD